MASGNSSSHSPKAALGEFEAIALLQDKLSRRSPMGKAAAARSRREEARQPRVRVGIGDDAAVLDIPAGDTVWSTDSSLEGVHFDRSFLSLELAAARAVHAAVSDVAAMGARPVAALVALELPPGASRRELTQIGRGQAIAAEQLGCPIVGGNISRGGRFGFTTSVLGHMPSRRARLRSAALPGDEVWLSHCVGWAALGLHLLQAQVVRVGERGGLTWATPKAPPGGRRAVRAWQRPLAKVAEASEWATRAHAMIDISDGLASEATHIAVASRVCLVLNEALLWRTHGPLVAAAKACGVAPERLILAGGEDYVLLGTGPGAKRPAQALVVGRVEAGEATVVLESTSHRRNKLGRSGHDHLR